MSFSISGFNNIDTEAMIAAIMYGERAPLRRLQQNKAETDQQLEVWRKINTELSTLKDKVKSLEGIFSQMKADSGDEEVFSASANKYARAGSYQIEVLQLAQSHRVASTRLTEPIDPGTDLNLGLTDTGGTFTINVGSNSFQVTVSGDDSLNDVMDQINNADGNLDSDKQPLVEASIIDNTLVLESVNTGASQQLSFIDDNGVLAELGIVDGSNNIQLELQAAQDAVFKVDSLQITRDTNQIDDVLTGVTLQLEGKLNTKATLTVGTDQELIKEKITAFVDQFNHIQEQISQYSGTTTDQDGNIQGGVLTGESAVRSLESALHNSVVLSSSTISSTDWLADQPLTAGGDLVINGSTVSLAGSETLQEIVDKINAAGIAGVNAELDGQRIAIEADGLQAVDLSASSSRVLSDLKLPEGFANNTLSMLGIEVDKFGKLSIDQEELAEALTNNLSDLEQMVTGVNGVIDRVEQSIDLAIGSYSQPYEGYIVARINSLESEVGYINEGINRLEDRLAMREQRVVLQFSQMDRLISQLNNQADWFSAQVSMF
ncbi:MAG: flagellar filament capping protein FliD [Halanaerobiales bacterium]|nr:flagellar filament capping protein FliD [Halanaerobiales bacterium]